MMESPSGPFFVRRSPHGPLLPVTAPVITVHGIVVESKGTKEGETVQKTIAIEQSNRVERKKHLLSPIPASRAADKGYVFVVV